ncbi:ABC transporter substrate-binding protein [Actinomadura macra]|uniref:ABC transporter substrate-binding protein n=1 Tax=Actinomadura macra TaxID=46164 RepID=UPI0008353552|nr:extracellular solute-binding protein [Actinomadura macra]
MGRHRTVLRWAAAVIGVTSAFAMTACGGGPSAPTAASAPPKAASDLYTAAKAEGTLMVYGPFQSTYKPLYDQFTRKYPGITVKTTDLFGPPLTARLQAEIATGKLGADLLATGPVDLGLYAQRGWLTSYKPEGSAALDPKYVGERDFYVEPLLAQATMFYNTRTVKPADLPKTWAALLDPKWKGKIALPDPAIPGLSSQSLAATEKAGVIDRADLKTLSGNATKYATVPAAIQAVATGQKQIGMVAAYQLINNAGGSGAPVTYFTLDDGTPATGTGYAVPAKAKHPNAAMLLSAWLLTPEAQQGIGRLGLQGTAPGAPAPVGGLPGLSQLKIIDMDLPATELAATQKELTSLFGAGG